MGWCNSCNDLVAREVLPTAKGESKLASAIEALQSDLRIELRASTPKRKWWQLRPVKNAQQLRIENEITLVSEKLAEYQLRRSALSTRTSKERCLNCGSKDSTALPSHAKNYYDTESTPNPIGFKHPGCEGELVNVCDGTRLNLRLTEKAYDLEGRKLTQDQ